MHESGCCVDVAGGWNELLCCWLLLCWLPRWWWLSLVRTSVAVFTVRVKAGTRSLSLSVEVMSDVYDIYMTE
jgi:hypothetical protein